MRRIVIEIKKHSKVSLTPVQGERLDYAIKRFASHLRGLEPKQVLLQDYDPRVSSKYRYTPAPALLKVLKKALDEDGVHGNGQGVKEVEGRATSRKTKVEGQRSKVMRQVEGQKLALGRAEETNGHQPLAISHQPVPKASRKRQNAKGAQQRDDQKSKPARKPAGSKQIQAAKSRPVAKPAPATRTAKSDTRPLAATKTRSMGALSQAKAPATSKEQTTIKKTKQQVKGSIGKTGSKKLEIAKKTKSVKPTSAPKKPKTAAKSVGRATQSRPAVAKAQPKSSPRGHKSIAPQKTKRHRSGKTKAAQPVTKAQAEPVKAKTLSKIAGGRKRVAGGKKRGRK